MFYIYVLHSKKDGNLYIGYTTDLRKRIYQHKNCFVTATKNRQPVSLIYFETYINQSDAKRRELYLKGGKGHNEMKIQLQDTFRKIKYRY